MFPHTLIILALKAGLVVGTLHGPTYPIDEKCNKAGEQLVTKHKWNPKRADRIQWRCDWLHSFEPRT